MKKATPAFYSNQSSRNGSYCCANYIEQEGRFEPQIQALQLQINA